MSHQFHQDIELPDQGDRVIRTEDLNVRLNPNGVANELFLVLQKNKDAIGQIEALSGSSETYGAVLERSIRVAVHLIKLGVTSEDILAPCITNHLNISVVLFGILFTGAKPAWLDAYAPEDEIMKQLELVQPKLVFAQEENVTLLETMISKLQLDTKIVLFGKTEQHIPFENFLVPLPEEEMSFVPYATTDLFQTVFIVFSSGTTGFPKGICIHHYGFLSLLNNRFDVPGQHVHLSYVLLVSFSGLYLTCLCAVLGDTVVLCPRFNCESNWLYLQKYNITHCYLAPYNILALLKFGKPANIQLTRLKSLVVAGGALGELSLRGIKMYLSKPAMAGKPIRGLTYKIVDPETEEILGPNQQGELRIKSKFNMNGYHKEQNKDYLDADGFLKTGDIMYYDEDHCFFFVGRLKELLWYKIYPIAPHELESILMQHPSVKIAVVIGTPSKDGDLPTALIVRLNDGVTEEELEAFVADRVEDRKKLRGGVHFIKGDQISFTSSGKIKKNALGKIVSIKNCT